MFLGAIGSAQNSKTFELCLYVRPSVRPSVCGKYDCVRTQRATDLKASITHTLVGKENGLYRSTGCGTSHISQIGKLGS